MARPREETLLYFPHDCDAHYEPEKMEPLMLIHGLAGYAHYFILLEMIYATSCGYLDISQPEKRKLIARKMFCKEKQFEQILKDEIRFGLFDSKSYEERGWLISNGITRRRETIFKERTRKRKGYSSDTHTECEGKTPEECRNNTGETGGKGKGKGNEKGERKGNSGETPAATKIERVALEKALKAWPIFEDLVKGAVPGNRLVIDDPISREVFFDLGGSEKIQELLAQNGSVLKTVFCAKYAHYDAQNFERQAARGS